MTLEEKNNVSDNNFMRKKDHMSKYYKKYFVLFAIGVCADIMVDYVQLYLPEFLGEIVEIVANTANPLFDDIAAIIKGLIIVGLLLFIGRVIMRFSTFFAAKKIEASLRHEMFLKGERLSQRYFHENKVGSIMSWFISDLESIEEYTGWGTIMIVDAVFLAGITVYKMIVLDWLLAIAAIIPMITLIIWGNKVEKVMSDLWDKRQSQFDKLYDYTQEAFSGIRVIKAFVKEVQEIKSFSKVAKKNADANIDFAKKSVIFDVFIEVIIGVIFAFIMAVGSYFVYLCVDGEPLVILGHTVNMTAGKLTTFTGYVDTLIWPMIAMGQIVQMRSRYKASLARISVYLDEEEEIHNAENAVVMDECKGGITFNNFSFHYPDTDIHSLNNISFTIKPGEMVGVVGKIGSGKTTLVNTLLRLYNVEKGQIFIDETDLMDLDIKNLRDNIAYVPQDNFLFSDNIKNNIAFSNSKVSIDKIRSAALFADVDENIMGFKQGYETITGERGVTLSGGQKQRISIARAYIKDAPIMIMDDSVSAVDVKTEETILANIKEHRKGKTTIIIASRVSTVSHLDKILVLNDGRVEAFDTPENLLKISPTYAKMVYLQKLENEL